MNEISFPPKPPPRKHSRLGIVSCIIAILVFLIVIGDIAIVLRLQKNPTVLQDFEVIDPVLTCLTAILAMAGLGLGIAAVVRKEKKGAFRYIGLIFNALFLLGIFGLYVINIALMRVAGG